MYVCHVVPGTTVVLCTQISIRERAPRKLEIITITVTMVFIYLIEAGTHIQKLLALNSYINILSGQ